MMLRIRFVLTAIAMMAVALSLGSRAMAQDATYRLQVEDVLRVQVYNETQVDAQVPIGQDGNVSVPFIGNVKAVGRTIDELSAELTQAFIRVLRLRDPKVSVTILRFREMRATVVGMVARPGSFPVRRGDTVVTLLGAAGGLIQERSDPYRATLRRAKSQEQIPIDLYALLYRGDTSQNYEVEDGDELLVPTGDRNIINVLGAIQRPMQYPYRDGMTLNDVLALSGGEIPGRTMLSKTLVFRPLPGQSDQYETIKADMVRFFVNHDFAQNVTLKPGDIVYFNKTKTPLWSEIGSVVNSLWITNSVLRQGLFGFKPF